MSPTIPLFAANQTLFSSKGSIALMLKLSINIGSISTEVKFFELFDVQETKPTNKSKKGKKRIYKIFRQK